MIEPLWIAACVSAGLCVVAWIAVCWRRAGLVPTRWLSAAAIALFVACVPGFVAQILATRFPGDHDPGGAYLEAARVVEGFAARLAAVGPLLLLLPFAAGLGCGRVRRSWRHGLAEAASWGTVTLPLVWLWYLSQQSHGFHFSVLAVWRETIVDLAIGPAIAVTVGVCAVVLRQLARRGGAPGRLHWIAFAGPLVLFAARACWSSYLDARAELPRLDPHWCSLVPRAGVDIWTAAPELCGGRARIEVWCEASDVHGVLWQEPSGMMHVDVVDESAHAAPPSAEALRPAFDELWEREERSGRRMRRAGLWASRAMTGGELAAWLAVLQANGVESVDVFVAIEYGEQHPLYGPLVRRNSCPIGRLTAEDGEVVRAWGRLDRAVLDGRFRELQRGRPGFTLHGDGSPRERAAEAEMADWAR